MDTKQNHQKTAKKKQFSLLKKIQPGSRKELVLLINSVLEDTLIYHLRLEENFFFFEKKSFKKLQVLTL